MKNKPWFRTAPRRDVHAHLAGLHAADVATRTSDDARLAEPQAATAVARWIA